MYVTGAERWGFLSYCPRFPALVLTVRRDEKAMAAIAEALERFWAAFDAGWAVLVERNGGPPKPPSPPIPVTPAKRVPPQLSPEQQAFVAEEAEAWKKFIGEAELPADSRSQHIREEVSNDEPAR